jgi:hypothetical protein
LSNEHEPSDSTQTNDTIKNNRQTQLITSKQQCNKDKHNQTHKKQPTTYNNTQRTKQQLTIKQKTHHYEQPNKQQTTKQTTHQHIIFALVLFGFT